jgi:hypothetical protein
MGLDTTGPGKDHANAIIATWNCLLYVGAVFGGISYSFISNKWGRKVPIGVGSFFAILGGALQAGSVNIAMLAVARVIIGLGIGMLLPSIPLYQAEVSSANHRGLMVGLHGKHSYRSDKDEPLLITSSRRFCVRLWQYACSIFGLRLLQIRRTGLLARSFGHTVHISPCTHLSHINHARKSKMVYVLRFISASVELILSY